MGSGKKGRQRQLLILGFCQTLEILSFFLSQLTTAQGAEDGTRAIPSGVSSNLQHIYGAPKDHTQHTHGIIVSGKSNSTRDRRKTCLS